MGALLFLQGVDKGIDIAVDAEVNHFESCTFHHHADQVLADVVDVAFDGADNHFADRLGAGSSEYRFQKRHAGLHRIGRHQYFGNKQNAVAKIDTDNGHARNQRLVQHLGSFPAPVQQNLCSFGDLFGHAIVEIIVHLLDEFFVRKFRQDDFFVVVFFSHSLSSLSHID